MTPLEEIIAHLGAALIQVVPSDDHIIVGHMRDAHTIAVALLRTQRWDAAVGYAQRVMAVSLETARIANGPLTAEQAEELTIRAM